MIVRVLPSPSTWTRWPIEKPASIQERPSSRVTELAGVPESISNSMRSAVLPPPCTTVRPPCGPGQKTILRGRRRERREHRAALEPQRLIVRALDAPQPPGTLEPLDHHELAFLEAGGLPGEPVGARDVAAEVAADDRDRRRCGDLDVVRDERPEHRGDARDRLQGAGRAQDLRPAAEQERVRVEREHLPLAGEPGDRDALAEREAVRDPASERARQLGAGRVAVRDELDGDRRLGLTRHRRRRRHASRSSARGA